MRWLFGCLAVFLGAVSISLAARYGYKGADSEVDGVISAIVFGAIALCAFIFDAAAVRLWFAHHRLGAVVIGLISAAALVVTFTNSLGAIAGRADTTQAERSTAKTTSIADRAELDRIMRERAAMAAFAPATADAVKAARAAVAAAEGIRQRECGNGDTKQRGPNCRLRETEEQGKRDALATVLANQAAAERAAKLDQDAAAVRMRLAKAPRVENPNPLGATLELLVGAAAAALTAWQQAIVAAVFELCLVGVMVIYELLGQARGPTQQAMGATRNAGASVALEKGHKGDRVPTNATPTIMPPPRRKAGTRGSCATGSVKSFVRDHVFPADGERVEMKTLMQDYRAWCAQNTLAPMDLNGFLDEVEKVCRKLGIEIDVSDDRRVYCLNVKLKTGAANPHASVH